LQSRLGGLDGIQSRIDLGANNLGPFDVDIAQQDAEFRSKITPLPRSLYAALDSLKKDHAFLLNGAAFTESFVDGWIASKRTTDAAEIASRPHPHEYQMYLDV
jgi:glutamine synthetase